MGCYVTVTALKKKLHCTRGRGGGGGGGKGFVGGNFLNFLGGGMLPMPPNPLGEMWANAHNITEVAIRLNV